MLDRRNRAKFNSRYVFLFALIFGFASISSLVSSPVEAVSSRYIEGTDQAAFFFNPLEVTNVYLTAPQSTIDGINADPAHTIYYPARISIETDSGNFGPFDVGIHLKGGWGSTRTLDGKAGFKVNVNYGSKPKQTILGLKKLTFNNMVQDPSMVHEVLAYRLFRSVGVAAPRVGYANVYLNDVSYGLHTTIETMDKVSLPRWFTTTRHLFEGSYFPDVVPDNRAFSVDTGNKTKLDDLDRLIEINQLDGAAWYKAMGTFANLEQMTLEWATEIYIGHWDGYVHNKNNYFLHSDNNNRFSMLPWGTDQTFDWAPDLSTYEGNGIMFQKCQAHSPCKKLYEKAVLKVWEKAQSLSLSSMVTNVSKAIEADMLADTRKEYDSGSVYWHQQSTKYFLANRIADGRRYATPFALVKPTLKAVVKKRDVTLSWSGAQVSGVRHSRYVLQKSSDKVNWVTVASTSELNKKFTNVAKGTQYYRVAVVTTVGTTPYSSTVTVKVV